MSRDAAALLVADANADDVALAMTISETWDASKVAADADEAALRAMHHELEALRVLMHTWETTCEAVFFYAGTAKVSPEDKQEKWIVTMAALEPVFEHPSRAAVDAALDAAPDANYNESVTVRTAATKNNATPAAKVKYAAMKAAVAAKFDRPQYVGPGEEVESLLSWAGSYPEGGPCADGGGFRSARWQFLVETFYEIRARQERRMRFWMTSVAQEGAPPSRA